MSTLDAFSTLTLADAKALVAGSDALLALALERARSLTDGGKRIDDHQVTTERVAYAATEGRAAHELVALLVDSELERLRPELQPEQSSR